MDEIRESIKRYYNVYFNMGAIYERLAKMHGLTSSSLFVLDVLHAYPKGCTQRFICESLFYPKQTVNAILNAFEKKGYIKKEIDHYDKRNKNVLLTESGSNYARIILCDMFYMEETAFAKMEKEKREAVIQGEFMLAQNFSEALNFLEESKMHQQAKPGSETFD